MRCALLRRWGKVSPPAAILRGRARPYMPYTTEAAARLFFAAHLIGRGFYSRFNPAMKRLPRDRLLLGKYRARRKNKSAHTLQMSRNGDVRSRRPSRIQAAQFRRNSHRIARSCRSELPPRILKWSPAVRFCGDSLPPGIERRKRSSPRCGERTFYIAGDSARGISGVTFAI